MVAVLMKRDKVLQGNYFDLGMVISKWKWEAFFTGFYKTGSLKGDVRKYRKLSRRKFFKPVAPITKLLVISSESEDEMI